MNGGRLRSPPYFAPGLLIILIKYAKNNLSFRNVEARNVLKVQDIGDARENILSVNLG
jgi:hypothetical protein